MTRITTCLACKHTGPYETFFKSDMIVRLVLRGMYCPKCDSHGPFDTRPAASDQTTCATAASAAATVETDSQETTMATEAPTKKRRGKEDESDVAEGEQLMLLDVDDPRHKPLITKLKKWRKIKLDREDALNEAKEAEDEAAEAVIDEMHALELKVFSWDGHDFSLEEREKLKMKSSKRKQDDAKG